jgi:hypothetical protein
VPGRNAPNTSGKTHGEQHVKRSYRTSGQSGDALLAELKARPMVPAAPHADGPQGIDVVRRTLARAGYDLELGE